MSPGGASGSASGTTPAISVTQPLTGIYSLQALIDFDSLDGQPVRLVVLFLVPHGEFQKHLPTLADIAKLLHRSEFRQALEEAPDAAGIYRIIRENSGA